PARTTGAGRAPPRSRAAVRCACAGRPGTPQTTGRHQSLRRGSTGVSRARQPGLPRPRRPRPRALCHYRCLPESRDDFCRDTAGPGSIAVSAATLPSELALPWHANLWQQVRTSLKAGRMAHALLVCGPPGVGKRRFAERLARALLCHTPHDNADACGPRPAWRQWGAGARPDVALLGPQEAGGLIRVEPMRVFTRRLQLTPQYRQGRLGWIDPAEQLNIAAANSLLKTLEEPP